MNFFINRIDEARRIFESELANGKRPDLILIFKQLSVGDTSDDKLFREYLEFYELVHNNRVDKLTAKLKFKSNTGDGRYVLSTDEYEEIFGGMCEETYELYDMVHHSVDSCTESAMKYQNWHA